MHAPKHRSVLFSLFLSLICLPGPRAAAASDGEAAEPDGLAFLQEASASVPLGRGDRSLAPYFFVRSRDGDVDLMPLKAVDAQVTIAGVIAEVKLTQTYENAGRRPLSAVYIFPASTRAAVQAMKMTIGEREIEARIAKRAEAREDYEQARDRGQSASLLEQQRPNVFQMSVANILPGDRIRVELTYTELLVPEDKQYAFVLPMVVGPRYSNQAAKGAPESERWVENPYLQEGHKAGFDSRVEVRLKGGLPIARVGSPSHAIDVEYLDAKTACIELKDPSTAGDRDFVLRYALAGERIEQGLLLYEGPREKFFLAMLEPPARVEKTDLVSREYLFVLDVSGSMNGFPLDTSMALMRDLLRDLRSYDYFNILLFAGGSRVMAPRSLPATRANVRKAKDWLRLAAAGGGTELLPALRRALAMPRPDKVSRSIVVLTDGFVQVEKETFSLIRERLGQANLFAFGIGSSVNRFLIEGMARAGAGEPFVVSGPGEAEAQAERFRTYISAPLMRNIAVRFEGFEAYDVEPAHLPDLFADRPLVVVGKYRSKGAQRPQGRVIIEGQGPDGALRREVSLAAARRSDDNRALRALWARQRVRRLADDLHLNPGDAQREEVEALGLAYGLLTEFTSFVAVDSRVRGDGKRTTTVRQPLPLPQGVSNMAVGGRGLLGALGTTGRGGGAVGYGSGSGSFGGLAGSSAVRGHSGRVMARAMVTGSVSKDVIRRTIGKHAQSVKRLYERQLKTNPKLEGKVVVKLTIAADGKVSKAGIASSTLGDPDFEKALLALVKRWRFPAIPGGGTMEVNYPFIFRAAP